MSECVISEKVDIFYGERILKLTKDIVFKDKMDSHLEKKSCEAQALAICRLIMGDISSGLKTSDAPDLQNSEKRLGIEVVSSYMETYRRIESLERKYQEELKHCNINNSSKLRKKIEIEGFSFIGNHVSYPLNIKGEMNVLLNTIFKKTTKIEKYKSRGFDRIGLFVWLSSPIASEIISNITQDLSLLLKDAKPYFRDTFDFLIVQADNYTFSFNKNFDFAGVYLIPFIFFKKIPTFGRMVAEGMIGDEDLS